MYLQGQGKIVYYYSWRLGPFFTSDWQIRGGQGSQDMFEVKNINQPGLIYIYTMFHLAAE